MFSETFLPATDGIVTRLCATLRHFEEEGHEVLLFAPEGAPDRYGAAKIIGVRAFEFFLYPEKNFALPRSGIGRAIEEFRPDLIHSVNPAFLGLAGQYYAWKFNLPYLASFHTNVPMYARHYHLNWLEPGLWWYFRMLHRTADINLCTSRATLHELQAHGFQNLDLWERGVDVELYEGAQRTDQMREQLAKGFAATDKILLYVGRLAAEKGLERLKPVLDASPGISLAIVGDGPHRAELERVFKGSKTTFVGYLHGEKLAEAYASADGFVFPSTTETLGLVLFEALAAGLPVMAADSPPTREVLENGAAGFIFDATDQRSILEALHELFYNEERRTNVVQRGRDIASSLDWKGPTEQLLGYYQRLSARSVPLAAEAVSSSRTTS